MGYVPIFLALLAALALPARAEPLDPNGYTSLGALEVSSGSLLFNTDTLAVSGAFSGTGVLQSQGAGLPDIAVFTFSSIDIASGVMLSFAGSRPIALLSQADAAIGAVINVQGAGGTPGGAFFGAGSGGPGRLGGGSGGGVNGASTGPGRGGAGDLGAGGGGGGFGGTGGTGGNSITGTHAPGPGGVTYGDLLEALVGGSGGGQHFLDPANGGGGAGGGAIEIGAVGTLTLSQGISARGGLGAPTGGSATASSGGGGSGGAIIVHGAAIVNGAVLDVRGGVSPQSGTGGGGGGGGRILFAPGAFTLGDQAALSISLAGGAGGSSSALGRRDGLAGGAGTLDIAPVLTTVAAGQAIVLDAQGRAGLAPGTTLHAADLRVASGGVVVAAAPFAGRHDLELQGGFVVANSGWAMQAGRQIAGFGTLTGQVAGGAGNSIHAAGGTLTLGDANSASGFVFGGAIQLASGATLGLQDADGAELAAGGTMSASGDAAVDGRFINQGMVHGPGGMAQLVFLDDVSGAGGYTGNITFSDGFAPGNSPGSVTFAGNATYDASSLIEMELGADGHDRIVVEGLLDLQGGALEVSYLGSFSAGANASFDLFDWQTLSGTFGNITLPDLAGGLAWDTSRLYLDGSISVAAIPEPQTWALLLAGLGLLGFAARRARKGVRPHFR